MAMGADAADTNGDGAVDRGEFSEVGLDLLAASE